MTDIVYILGPGSKWNDNELKYSIRSVVKHAKNHGKIWIVGNEPRCELDCPTTFVPRPHNKNISGHANVRESLKLISNTPECSEKFIFMNDDFFLVQDVENIGEIPNYYCGLLSPRSSNFLKDSPGYWRTICYTWAVLSSQGYATKDYEVHGPMLMEKSKVITTLGFPWTDNNVQLRSIYGNVFGGQSKLIRDSKLGMKLDKDYTKEKLLKDIDGRPWFSIGDGLSDEVKTVFETLYPKTEEKTYVPTPNLSTMEKINEAFAYSI